MFHKTFNLNIHYPFKDLGHVRENTDRPIVSLSKSSFFLKIELTSATFKSSGKQSFLKDKLMHPWLMILVRTEVQISIVDFSIPAGICPTGVAFLPSDFEISFRTLSSVNS